MPKFYHIPAIELAWRGGEAVACLLDFRYSVKLAKAVQKAVQIVKWLITNSDSEK